MLLALRIAAVVLLALAFARPYLASGASGLASGVTVVALDTSFSLSAPGRFEHAQELAREAVAKAPTGHLVGVVTFAESADLVAPPSGIRQPSRQSTRPGPAGSTRYQSALSVAATHSTGDLYAGRRHQTQARGWDGEQVGWSKDVPSRWSTSVCSELAITRPVW
jgi:secreted protein with Ig-like and vWFA domain